MKKLFLIYLIPILIISCNKAEQNKIANDVDTTAIIHTTDENIHNSAPIKNTCACTSSDVRNFADKTAREMEKSQDGVPSNMYNNVRVENVEKIGSCSFSVVFKIINAGEEAAGWDRYGAASSSKIQKLVKCDDGIIYYAN